ncbi:SusD/RagB family nutrient-binding outer membrane lipoprotein [Hymenobacter amundsenii]|uniref:SusD/RagB family nutrient-binding outer membrane lipoprotein n=1 Tax=Hymenobacter amundsenii TaxID=2006685 RepID=A0A246FL17_9BACT|nr:SusD/RagB family nutrient-binding outer membrane lipoprotein [Hymenobacter amundsenii]OWP63389.1 SusD/RagB family nutrient-binding outer membrane lipoprotein [Hymenobacter amundsenii]
MKYQQYLGFALAGVVALGTVGCKDFLDVNANPNNPETVPPSVLLTATAIQTGFSNGNEINRITSLLVQHIAGAGNQAAAQDVYNIRGGLDNQWQGELYAGSLEDAQKLIEISTRLNSPAYAGIGKLLKAYNFAMTTDLWGDIPYSQALMGLDQLKPRFDKQEDIYKGADGIQSLDALVKEGLADLLKTSDLMPSAADDPIYRGDLVKWAQMGNTLRLKLANTMSRREPALAATIINEVVNAKSAILTNANDFEVPFGGAVGNRNPIFDFGDATFGQRPLDLFLSQRLLDSMRVKNDPRLPVYFTTTPTPTATVNTTGTLTTLPGATAGTFLTFTGFQNGANVATPVSANRSRYNTYIAGASGAGPIRLLTNVQRLFIMAESALVLKTATDGGTVQSLYQAAIRASMVKAGISDAAVTTYFTNNPSVAILSGSDTRKLNQIMTQKWISWVGNGYEAYNDYRRTGYPRLTLALNAQGDDPNVLPKRFVYPASELSGNATNAPNPAPGTTVPVWWDID